MTEQEKTDVKDIKELIKMVISCYKAYLLSAKDGKIDLNDLGNLMIVLPTLQPAFEGINTVPAEFKDLEAAEAEELSEFYSYGTW